MTTDCIAHLLAFNCYFLVPLILDYCLLFLIAVDLFISIA